ncbi:MAG: hypothetical protein JWP01_2531 [Myxococcales bacterium]|nr:hypothetical protein [Myxococcales bacterium]
MSGTTGMSGLRIVWDPAIDQGAWPGPLAGRSAVVGELWLGPVGLLARLETELGLGAVHTTPLERAGELAGQLATRTGWWRASYEADPLGTCQRLLRDRDLLFLWGWRGEAASDRLAALWTATSDAKPGFADRLAAVTSALVPGRMIDIECIELVSPINGLAPAWRSLFAQLGMVGVRIVESARATATAGGDLANGRSAGFVPTGDGSLTLLRPHGPLAAADEVAASLAAMPSLDGVLVIGADDVLDAALVRHGLPCVGAATRPTASSALIRLVIEAAFEPMDPADLHALLTLWPGPIRRPIASNLVDALSRFPGRRTAEWKKALEDGLELVEEDRRTAVRERIETLVMPAARRDGMLTAVELDRRLALLGTWARSRLFNTPSLAAIAALTVEARSLLARYGATELSLVQLRRLCDDLDRSSGIPAVAHAGLASVTEPGAVLARARVILWWNFTRESAPSLPRMRLSNAERAELLRLGVTPPDPGLLMEGEASRWRRPLDLTTETLVLVCPRTTETGDECAPHPLWDELRAAMTDSDQASILVATRLTRPASAVRQTATLRPLPSPTVTVTAGSALPLRTRESHTSLNKLLGCSLSWALEYHGKLRSGLAAGPSAPSPLLYGNLAHHVFAEVFGAGVLDAETALARAHEILDRDLGSLAESLALPRYQVERTAVRKAILDSAHELGALLIESGASVRGVELAHEGDHGGIALTGKADLLLTGPDVVIDLKWGVASHYDKLRTGTALQLAMYAEMFGSPGAIAPDVAFFSLKSQDLFAPPGTPLRRAKVVGTTAPRDTWNGALVAIGARRTELAAGHLHAPAADATEHKSHMGGGRLNLAPDCQYCSYGALCGKGGCT